MRRRTREEGVVLGVCWGGVGGGCGCERVTRAGGGKRWRNITLRERERKGQAPIEHGRGKRERLRFVTTKGCFSDWPPGPWGGRESYCGQRKRPGPEPLHPKEEGTTTFLSGVKKKSTWNYSFVQRGRRDMRAGKKKGGGAAVGREGKKPRPYAEVTKRGKKKVGAQFLVVA